MTNAPIYQWHNGSEWQDVSKAVYDSITNEDVRRIAGHGGKEEGEIEAVKFNGRVDKEASLFWDENSILIDGENPGYHITKSEFILFCKTIAQPSLVPSAPSVEQELVYWRQRCLAAEDFIHESPGDPDVTPKQIIAHSKWWTMTKEVPDFTTALTKSKEKI